MILKVIEQRNVQSPKVSAQLSLESKLSIDEETFSSILNHLLQNAQEATNDDGWVKIKAEIVATNLHISITDNGCGMSADFIANRLFKPFDTTKGNAGMGIGVYEARQFIESVNGTIQVTSCESEGSHFKIVIPSKK